MAPDTLQSMSHLSLRERVETIKIRLGRETFDTKTLRSYYLKHGIGFRRPDYRYWRSLAENKALKEEQMEFALQLGSILHLKTYDEVVYVDETTCNLWQKMNRAWVKPGMKLLLLKNRGPSITVIGGISQERGSVHHHIIAESNNASHFQDFLLGLKRKCQGRRTLIVLDNLKIHYAKKNNHLYDQDFKLLFLPPYSSELNPIERLWAILKLKWRKHLQLYIDELQGVKETRSSDQLAKLAVSKLRETLGKK